MKPDKLPLKAYAEAASLDRLTLSAGDAVALLKGNRLDEVANAELDGITLTPSALNRVQDFDQLAMSAAASTANLEPGKHYGAKVELRDGRQLKVPVTVDPPRPQVTLLSKGTQDDASTAPIRCIWASSGRPARRQAAGLLSQVPRARELSPRRKGGSCGGGRQLPHRAVAGRRQPDAGRCKDRGGNAGSAGALRFLGLWAGAGARDCLPMASPATGCPWERWCGCPDSRNCAARAPSPNPAR